MNSPANPIYVKCPTCQKAVVWSEQSQYRPFCSKRCQLIDLGEWASEEHRIAGEELINEEMLWNDNPLQDDE